MQEERGQEPTWKVCKSQDRFKARKNRLTFRNAIDEMNNYVNETTKRLHPNISLLLNDNTEKKFMYCGRLLPFSA